MGAEDTRWVARLTPTPASSLDALLGLSLGLDVWERGDDSLLVAASEAQLSEIERRRLAAVDRLSSVAGWADQARRAAGKPGAGGEGGPAS